MALDYASTTTQEVRAGDYLFHLNYVGQWQYDSEAARIEIQHGGEPIWRNERILFDLGLCDVSYVSDSKLWRSPLVLSSDSRFALLRVLGTELWNGWRALLILDLQSRSFAVAPDRPVVRFGTIVADNGATGRVTFHHYRDDQLSNHPECSQEGLIVESSDFVPMRMFWEASIAEDLKAWTKEIEQDVTPNA